MATETLSPTGDLDSYVEEQGGVLDRHSRPRLSFSQFTARVGVISLFAAGTLIGSGLVISDDVADKVVEGTTPELRSAKDEIQAQLDEDLRELTVRFDSIEGDASSAAATVEDIRVALIELGVLEVEPEAGE